jgi:hypothetical protein
MINIDFYQNNPFIYFMCSNKLGKKKASVFKPDEPS